MHRQTAEHSLALASDEKSSDVDASSYPESNFSPDIGGGRTDRKMVTYTPTNHVVELTKFALLLLAELTGIWSLLCGGTQLRMFTFNTWPWLCQ